jgi:DNA-binding transcriptional ArsR family regulator
MEDKYVIKALAALAQPNRLLIFRSLVVKGSEGLTPAQLAEALGMPANTLSFHLKELMQADLISQERSGRNLIYRAQFDRMNAVLTYLSQNCCQGVPEPRCYVLAGHRLGNPHVRRFREEDGGHSGQRGQRSDACSRHAA